MSVTWPVDDGVKRHEEFPNTFHWDIQLKIKVDKPVLKELSLYPFGDNQEIIQDSKGCYMLSLTTNDNNALSQRLLSLGANIQIIEPASLAGYLKNQARKTLSQYDKDTPCL